MTSAFRPLFGLSQYFILIERINEPFPWMLAGLGFNRSHKYLPKI